MTTDDGEAPRDELSPRERARLRTRDRKRTTQMVVDNAGIKRTALALARRRAAGRATLPDVVEGGG
jgi:hypothetical protein